MNIQDIQGRLMRVLQGAPPEIVAEIGQINRVLNVMPPTMTLETIHAINGAVTRALRLSGLGMEPVQPPADVRAPEIVVADPARANIPPGDEPSVA